MKTPLQPPQGVSPAVTIQHQMQRVTSLLANGQPRPALHLAQESMALFALHDELCNIAGVCAVTLEEHGLAEHYWRLAIAVNPNAAQPYFNLGLLHASRQREDQAERYYRRAVALDPGNVGALANLGNLLAKGRRDEAAEECYRKLIAINPGDAAIHSNLGAALANRKLDGAAEQSYRRAIALDPDHAKAYSNLGILLFRGGRLDEAEQCHRRAIVLDPASAESYTNLGLLLERQRRFDQAERCHRRALALNPNYSEIHANLGNLLTQIRRETEAETSYRHALALDPGSAIVHSSLGVLLSNLGRETEAELEFRRAMTINPDYTLARLNLGFLLLRQGRFAEGWPLHETRYDPALPDQSKFPYPIRAPFPQWRGERLAGKALLVWPEQGLGDEIQFCRYLPLLKQQGAARITLVCKTALKKLMTTLAGVDAVLAADEAADIVAAHDYWTYPLSIPLHCRTDLTNIPAHLPYLCAPPDRLARWSRRLPRDGLRVGLVWKGNKFHGNDSDRSLPNLACLAPLWTVSGVRFISLQKGQDEDRAQTPPAGQPLLHLGTEIADFADTAAVVADLDLVICVDTAIAHLAGALAKPCWVLLPAYRPDWRWLQNRDDTPWYPGVMRLFHQSRDEDWTTTIQDIKNALMEKAARHVAGEDPIADNAHDERT
jgi:tetratricopeptide (TPR) repeat protein